MEWLPESLIDAEPIEFNEKNVFQSETSKKPQEKNQTRFDFVYCIGGDGTLLRLLRILFMRCLPSVLPKIVTFSMGSLSYLCNFNISEYQKILDCTALLPTRNQISNLIKVDYRSRLQC
jgi:NAD kinase